MRKLFAEKIAKLIDVKSLVTLMPVGALVISFMYCLISRGEIPSELLTVFISSLSAVITYFFTKKGSEKNEGEENEDS